MATFLPLQGLQFILRDVMATLEASGVSSIADFSIAFRLPPVRIVIQPGRLVQSVTSTVRLTFYLATGTVTKESMTVYEWAKDCNSPPFNSKVEYSRTPDMSFTEPDSWPTLFGSAIEDGSAPPSALDSALAGWCIEQARQALSHKEEG